MTSEADCSYHFGIVSNILDCKEPFPAGVVWAQHGERGEIGQTLFRLYMAFPFGKSLSTIARY